MKDLTFYRCLVRCFNQQENCKQCPMYANGHWEGKKCKRTLMDEVSRRKTEEVRKEEAEG